MSVHRSGSEPEEAGVLEAGRRRFITMVSGVAMAVCGAVMGLFNVAFLRPRVTYGAKSRVRVGRPDAYSPGSVMELPDSRLVVRRDGNRFAAISTVCTHLGCTVRSSEIGFDCPCHGSNYDEQGNVVGGPAPRQLAWYRIGLTPSGELEVDMRQTVSAGTYLELPS